MRPHPIISVNNNEGGFPLDDNVILDMYFARDEQGIEETKHKYGRRLFKTARNILYNNEDAAECVNDTLFKAWERIPPLRPEMFGAFLAKITRNMALNRWESKSAAKRGGGQTVLCLNELEECVPDRSIPESHIEQQSVTEAINSFLVSQDKEARIIFVSRYFHMENIKDIAIKYKMSESKVKSLLFRIRKKLKQHLEKEGINV